MTVLESLHILTTAQETTGARAYRLSQVFAESLRNALTGGGDHGSFGIPCDTPDKHKVDIQFLDAFARSRWEAILYYVVRSTKVSVAEKTKINQATSTLLDIGNFVKNRGHRAEITRDGFTFLLQEVNSQVWSLLIVYLENAPSVRPDFFLNT